MKCPHCGAELRYRERSGRRCSRCKQQFALEPRLDRLKLHDLRLGQLAQKLSAEGRLHYSADQLRYAAARKHVAAQDPGPRTAAQRIRRLLLTLSLSMLGVFGAFALTALFPPIGLPLLILILGVLLVIFAVRMLRGPRRPRMPISAPDFERAVLQPFRKLYGQSPPGLIDAELRARLDLRLPAPDALRGALVCPDPAVRECLLANQAPARFGLAVLPASPPLSVPEQAHLEALRRRPELPLLVLHDASPPGCVLPQSVLSALDLPADRRVLALGLRPRTAIRRKLLTLGARPDPALLAQLRQRGHLDADELAWLEAGKWAPLAALPPAKLLALVEQAIARLTPAQPSAVDPQQLAGAIGFMSWPTK